MRACALVLLAWCLFAGQAYAEHRLALVVGNDNYQNIEKLQKARADAETYAGVLRQKGFVVQEGYDLTYAELNAALATFVASVQPEDTVVFVYSGHGWSDGAQNYLVGVDAPASASEDELAGITTPVRNGANGVLDRIERRGAQLRVAVIDACRDNPFKPPSGQKGYSHRRGLAPLAPPPAGTFVVFSASAGETALDRLSEADADRNSVFTRVFAPLLLSDVSLQDAVKEAQEKVVELARLVDHDQKPSYVDEVVGPACLVQECKPNVAFPTTPVSSASDAAIAAMIDAATSAQTLAPLIAKLPDGPLKERAKARAEFLKKQTCSTTEVLVDDRCIAKTCGPNQTLTVSGACVVKVVHKSSPEHPKQEYHVNNRCFSFNTTKYCE